ncbi:hypothetical protein [Faecalispora anaeroviscerum]|uniref:hypothetical protein n=1 Tax=Faecalispora anaeroviscerum TaxID=2991836 RepID=UPI0024BA4FED|nr:hypothetical protein [Faecalispora anaeroviscerum]
MTERKQWSRLDNAAKIFPPTSTNRDTKVFRFVCELTEPVNSGILQEALEETIQEFPLYRSILKKGLFWYYLEESNIRPQVAEEALPVCSPIYNEDKPDLLFRVLYYKNRINLEVFHVLADGTGAMQFLRILVFSYLMKKDAISGQMPDYDASRDQKNQDAFYKYYDKSEVIPKTKRFHAYRIRGERLPDNRAGITEGFLSTKAVLQKAHENDATLSEFLVTLLIRSIYDGMAVRERNRPVVITVPVDLRRFFPAQTARNFFGVIQVSHRFQKGGQEFAQILANVRESFRRQLTHENLYGIISRYSALENNPLIKAIPLPLKIPILQINGHWADSEDTAAFSNIGQIVMPAEATRYIRLFDVFVSTKRPQLCVCSFGDTLAISVSSPFADTGIQRCFFRQLTEMGISVQVISNLEQCDGEEKSYAAV